MLGLKNSGLTAIFQDGYNAAPHALPPTSAAFLPPTRPSGEPR
jgi:hypothetical protein